MNKETFLKNYIEIETKIFIKKDKYKKLDDLFKDNQDYISKLNSGDVLEIIDYLTTNGITIRQQLYKNLIYPILSVQVDYNNLGAMKGLLKLDQQLISYQGYSKDTKYLFGTLLEKGLEISPNDKELLEISERTLRNYFIYTLHELPSGILFEANGASIKECEILIKDVEKYEATCSKLKRDESELIAKCKFYYQAYKGYLSVIKAYKNFDDYLNKAGERPK